MTPAQFFALLDRFKLQIRRDDLRTAIVAKTFADINRPADHPGYEIEIFMPSAEKPKREKLSPEVLWRKAKLAFGIGRERA